MNERNSESPPRAEFWCNFCGLKTADEKTYLAHSCTDELRLKGTPPGTDTRENHCR